MNAVGLFSQVSAQHYSLRIMKLTSENLLGHCCCCYCWEGWGEGVRDNEKRWVKGKGTAVADERSPLAKLPRNVHLYNKSVSETDLPVLPHQVESCQSNLLSHPVLVY